MIGGYDINFESEMEPQDVLREAWLLTSSFWKNAVVEDANSGALLSLSASGVGFAGRSEIFIYKDIAARNAWLKQGAENANLNSMIHVLAGSGGATLVVHNPNDPIAKKLIAGMRSVLRGASLQPIVSHARSNMGK